MYTKVKNLVIHIVLLVIILCTAVVSVQAHEPEEQGKTAIILASFGTTVPRALVAITNISQRVQKAFPETEVRLTFTSNIIRKVWRKRRAEAQKWLDQGVPKEVLYVQNIISTVGDLREEGFRNIIVQPTHMFYMEQSHDLNSYVLALGSIDTMNKRWRPFDNIVMGRPALGMPGVEYNYHEDVAAVVKTLAADAALAKKENAALVYMGHGNEHWSTGIYTETQKEMNGQYPEVKTYIGVVEGDPGIEDVLAQLQAAGINKVVLKPFMIVAGDHAMNDMASNVKDSWKSILETNGYKVLPVLEGLGSNNGFADLFVNHIKDVADQYNLDLK